MLYCLGAVLQTPDGGKAYVGTGYHLGGHHLHHTGEIQTVVLALESHAVETRLDESVEVAACARGIFDVAVDERGAYVVDLFGIGGYDIACDVTKEAHHHVVLCYCFLGIGGCFGMAAGFGIVLFLDSDYLLHVGVMQVEAKIFVICVKIHNYFRLFL